MSQVALIVMFSMAEALHLNRTVMFYHVLISRTIRFLIWLATKLRMLMILKKFGIVQKEFMVTSEKQFGDIHI